MGLVEYSDSESETETVQSKPTPATASAAPKKAFQKLLDRSSGAGKIVVNLSAASSTADADAENEQPPAKRARTAGGSRFSGLGSFLPPPKRTGAAAPTAAGSSKQLGSTPAPGVHLRTGAEPAFIRGGDALEDGDAGPTSGMILPPPNSRTAGPSIPEGQKPEDEVKLVGKPLMFKPLSVARKKAPLKKKKAQFPAGAGPIANTPATQNDPTATSTTTEPPPPKKKISLFSMGDDDTPPISTTITTTETSTYEPLFTTPNEPTSTTYDDEFNEETAFTSPYPTPNHPHPHPHPAASQHQNHLEALADNLDLTPAARRELFGRPGAPSSTSLPANAKVINFNMEREYAHNEALRASGAQQAHNPVRSIAPGKHSLRQVVNMAQSNQGALEESFARAKGSQREAAGRYGW